MNNNDNNNKNNNKEFTTYSHFNENDVSRWCKYFYYSFELEIMKKKQS